MIEVPEVEKMNLKTGDTLVIRFKRKLRPEERNELHSLGSKFAEGVKILVFDDDVSLSVVSSEFD